MNDSSFLILMLAIIAMMAMVPFLLRKFHVPAVISLLVVGMVIAPNGWGFDLVGWLSRLLSFMGPAGAEAQTAARTAENFHSLVNSLGALGLLMLMSLAGMEADFKLIKTVRMPVILLSILTFFVPAATGYFVYWCFCPNDLAGKLLYASLFASHSVGIVFPVIRSLNLTRSRFGASVLISTVITDIASIILLAVSVQLFRQNLDISHAVVNPTLSIFDHVDSRLFGNSFLPVFLGIVLLYLLVSVVVVNFVGKKLRQLLPPGEDIFMTLVLLIILVTAVIGELFGINLVVGAFMAGLGLSRIMQEEDMKLFRRFESIGYGFLIPFLFISIGMKSDFSSLSHGSDLIIVLATIAGLVASKLLSGFIAMKISGFSARLSLAGGLMTVPQLSATLAAAAIGKEAGILDDIFFNAIILLSLVTTLPIPNLVRWVICRGENEFHQTEVKLPHVVNDDQLL